MAIRDSVGTRENLGLAAPGKPVLPPASGTHAEQHQDTSFLRGGAGQPGVFKLGLNRTGVPSDSCHCGPPPLSSASPLPPTALAPSRSHLTGSALFTGKGMSIVPTLKEEMPPGLPVTQPPQREPTRFPFVVPRRTWMQGHAGGRHPCRRSRGSFPGALPAPLTPTHLRAPRLWPRPCGPACHRAARVL